MCFNKLRQLYNRHPDVYNKVKVFSVKLVEKPKLVAEASANVVSSTVEETRRESVIRVLTPSGHQLQTVAGGSEAKTTTDDRTRVVEVEGKRYRVVFKSVKDAKFFDRLSKGAVVVSVFDGKLVVKVRDIGAKQELAIELIESCG